MEDNDRIKLLSAIRDCKDEELQCFFGKIFLTLKDGSDLMKSWRKVQLAHALGAFHIKWFDLCRNLLQLALASESEISTDERYTKSLFKEAGYIDIGLLENEINKLKKPL